ncbi:uncharacterized protein LOC123320260 [Coccinella septempunctata]|uniref:uncharacterized protein LOC123320260 n=1 Tax=Coccinella septempunctata TaxID=41139 RepID=UPI001D078788|nr:uncharacterized protein LOC123320260 [Coccinella septempunctata]
MEESIRSKVIISQQMFLYIQPILTISRFLGLSPVRYQKNGQNYIISLSYLYVAYSYLFGLVLAGSAVLGLVGDLKANPEHSLRVKDHKGAYVVSCDLGLMIIIVILGIFISPFKIDKFFLILASLNQIHLKLPTSIKEGPRKTSFIISFVSYFVFFGVLTYDFIGWCIQTNGKPSSKRLWNNIPVYILYVVSWTQEIYFWHMTYFVKRCVQALNTGLSLHIEDKGKNVKIVDPKVQQKVYSIDNMGRTAPSNTLVKNILTSQKAKTFIHVHRILFEVVNFINDWYGIPLMLILLSCFLQLIGTPYFMLSNTNEKSIVFSILEVVWLFTHTSRLLIIVEASHRCVKEVRTSRVK